MKTVYLTLCFFFALSGLTMGRGPVKVILDTDMGPDFDDVGAITLLHSFAQNGECEILATVACDGYPTIAPTLEVFNRYFGKPDIPIGVPGKDAPSFSCPNHWNDSIVARYLPSRKTNRDYPPATEIYRKVLSAQPDHSVVIISVGFLSNLADLLKSAPDQYSSLNGLQLVSRKVAKWVAMAGIFPEGSEFNLNQHPEASKYVLENWPGEALFSGFEIGDKIMTGAKIVRLGALDSPARWAYAYCLKTYGKTPLANRNSWDLTAVWCGVRDPETLFYLAGPGRVNCDEKGYNIWKADPRGKQRFLVHKYPYQETAGRIEDQLLKAMSK